MNSMKIILKLYLLLLILSSPNLIFSQYSWHVQYPQPTGETLYDACFINDQEGWVVGKNGIIIHTGDGGTSWEFQNSGTTLSLRSVQFTDNQTGWITGGVTYLPGQYIILHTTDGGNNWITQAMDTTACLKSVFFIDQIKGWAVGTNGILLRTDDAGANWKSQLIAPTYNDLNEVLFVDSLNGWVASDYGLYKTTNGGISWIKQVPNSGAVGLIESVYFIDQNEGWAASGGYQSGYIMHSENSFATWDTIYGCGAYEAFCGFNSIYFNDAAQGWMLHNWCWNGWVSGCATSLLESSDDGNTWEEVDLNTTLYLNSLSFSQAGTGCIVGGHGVIFKKNDWDDPWQQISHFNNSCLYSISFPDKLNGWIVGSEFWTRGYDAGSIILNTSDGGLTWVEQNSGIDAVLNSVCFVDENTGWAAGYNDKWTAIPDTGYIIKTENGGLEWDILLIDSCYLYTSVVFIDENNGWVAGYGNSWENFRGRILRTNDGGISWQIQTCDTCKELNAIYFTDFNNGWIAGGQTVYHTTDGGQNWIEQSTGLTDCSFESLYFNNQLDGWIVGYYLTGEGIILHTTDGGNTWQYELSQTSLNSVHFSDQMNGVISGTGGTVLVTEDGGVTWELQDSGTENTLFNIYSMADGNVCAAGLWGTILVTNPSVGIPVHPLNTSRDFKVSCHPNPFASSTMIDYHLENQSAVTIVIFNTTGQKVDEININSQSPGKHEITLNAEKLPSGVYYYRIQAGSKIATGKIILLK